MTASTINWYFVNHVPEHCVNYVGLDTQFVPTINVGATLRGCPGVITPQTRAATQGRPYGMAVFVGTNCVRPQSEASSNGYSQ